MAGNSNQNGVLSGAASLRNPTASVASLTRAVEDFLAEMERVTTLDKTTGRARFPGFAIQPVIREKLASAVEMLDSGDVGTAWEIFCGADRHFNNQQAAFARDRLLSNLVRELYCAMEAKCDDDLIAEVRLAVEAYGNLVASVSDDGKNKPCKGVKATDAAETRVRPGDSRLCRLASCIDGWP